MSALPTGTLTLFFTDVESSTRLQHVLGERYDEALAQHHRIIRAALQGQGGHEVDTLGESMNAPLQGGERETHEVMLAESRERIGAEALQAAWAEGRAMATDDAVALALA